MFCLQCGNEIKDGAKFCAKCGWAVPATAVQAVEKRCASCGTALKDGVKFCPKCGTKVGAMPQVQPAPAPSVAPSSNVAQAQTQAASEQVLKRGLFTMNKPLKNAGALFLFEDRLAFIGTNNFAIPFGEISLVEKSDFFDHIKISMVDNTIIQFTPVEESMAKAFIHGALGSTKLLNSWFDIISHELIRWRNNNL